MAEWESANLEDSSLTETLLVIEVQNSVRASLERARAVMDHVERAERDGTLTDRDVARLMLAQAEVCRLSELLSRFVLKGDVDHDSLIKTVSDLLN